MAEVVSELFDTVEDMFVGKEQEEDVAAQPEEESEAEAEAEAAQVVAAKPTGPKKKGDPDAPKTKRQIPVPKDSATFFVPGRRTRNSLHLHPTATYKSLRCADSLLR